MSAVKNFFQHNRYVLVQREINAKKRKEEYLEMLRLREIQRAELLEKRVQEFDFLLKRNWFLDDESVLEFLWEADEVVFGEIVKRISTYPSNIQRVILACFPLVPKKWAKLSIRNLTENDMDLKEISENEAQKKMLQDGWESYKKDMNLQPPLGDLDETYDDLYQDLQVLKKELEEAKKKSVAGRYVPPAMRDSIAKTDPRVIELGKKVEKKENEITLQKQLIEQEHNAWFNRQRDAYEAKMLAV